MALCAQDVVVMKTYKYRSASGAIKITVLALAVLIHLAAHAVAQESPHATLRVATHLTAEPPLDEAYWAASLDRSIARSPRVIDVRRALIDGSASQTVGNLITVDVSAKTVGAKVKTEWRIIDPVDGSVFASGSEEGPSPSPRVLDELQWIPLVEALEKWDMLRIQALPGTEIEGIGSEKILIDESGEAEILVKMPEIYRWKARKSGMETRSGILSLPNGNTPLRIEMDPLKLWAVEAAVRIVLYPELRLYRGLAQDRLFVRTGFTQSLWAYKLGSNKEELLVSAYGGRFEPNLGYGFYFFGADHKIRPYLSVDLSLRLIHTKEAFLYFDLPGAFRLTPSFGMDFRTAPNFSAFFETGIDLIGKFDDTMGDFDARIGTRFRF
jgi:hypothetical protein